MPGFHDQILRNHIVGSKCTLGAVRPPVLDADADENVFGRRLRVDAR